MKQEQRRRGVQVQSVARAAEIIRCFLKEPELGISDIAAEMDLNKSTVFGLVNTLTSYGYLEQVESNKKYRLGITLFELGNLVLSRIDVRSEAKEICSPLAAKYPATVHIATHSEGEVIYIEKMDRGRGQESFTFRLETGMDFLPGKNTGEGAGSSPMKRRNSLYM